MKITLNNNKRDSINNNNSNLFNNKKNFWNIKKRKKNKKKQEKTMSDISQLNKIDLTKLLKNKRSYENEEENE